MNIASKTGRGGVDILGCSWKVFPVKGDPEKAGFVQRGKANGLSLYPSQ